jgi:NAD(P)-dependent dehydrogenase (short-subunit alcohol dehydrogenase family)
VIDDLTGAVAVVTGGGSGIGRATARSLGRAGAKVVVADVDRARAEAVAAEIEGDGSAGLGVCCDVGRDEDMAGLREAAVGAFGRVDIVMNNVGVLAIGRPEDIPVSAWERVLNLNVLSLARSLSVFLPGLLEQGSGHIVNTASFAGLYAVAYERMPYSASKAAVVAASEALALYTRPRGVGVTCLCPGPVRTNIAEQKQTFGWDEPLHVPPFPPIEASVVGDQVVTAIRSDTFLLLTHPDVQHLLVERASDPEAFLAARVRDIVDG